MRVATGRETTSSNMNSDLHQSAYGTFMNTPITPVYPNMNKGDKKSAPKEDPTYILNNV